MKIVMVSMPSLHFFRWTEQLKDSGHEVFWFDIIDGGQKVERISWVHQIVNWKIRWNYPGRYFIKTRFPQLYAFIQKFNERNATKVFEKKLLKIKPDVVHSFALYISCTPILSVMQRYKNIKWIYSSWGSDLFYYQNIPSYLNEIKKVLPEIDFLFTDCNRDYELAKKNGFKGDFLGVFPGGGGFYLEKLKKEMLPLNKRKIILIKGYEGRSGRAINVLKAIKKLKIEVKPYEIIVFGGDAKVFEYTKNNVLINWNNFTIYDKMPRREVLTLMGKALIYIGNSNSDGIPNTLIEAICMGAFPMQSNSGGATEEIIKDGYNGILIKDCENDKEIKALLLKLLSDSNLIKQAYSINQKQVKDKYDRVKIKDKVLTKYNKIKTA